jgi:hypothetical protein
MNFKAAVPKNCDIELHIRYKLIFQITFLVLCFTVKSDVKTEKEKKCPSYRNKYWETHK